MRPAQHPQNDETVGGRRGSRRPVGAVPQYAVGFRPSARIALSWSAPSTSARFCVMSSYFSSAELVRVEGQSELAFRAGERIIQAQVKWCGHGESGRRAREQASEAAP